VKFVEHRIADRRIVRLIQKWLKAGVLEDGKRIVSEEGTVQGGSISPLLANVYLHYVFDLWVQHWRKQRTRGEVIVVRYADDFVLGFQFRNDAEEFLEALRGRFAKFGLELHPEKTRLIEFGRFAERDRKARGEGKPETFNFLGFTHCCGKNRKGGFVVIRRTMRQRLQAKLKALKITLWRRMHDTIPQAGAYLRAVVRGHMQYYGVPRNGPSLSAFRRAVGWIWWRILQRRSQTGYVPWPRMKRLIARWFPLARICRPYPSLASVVATRGRSPVR
jgi:hypothetical protein